MAQSVEDLKHLPILDPNEISLMTLPSEDSDAAAPLKIGIVGFNKFGQSLARELSKKHHVSCIDTQQDCTREDKLRVWAIIPTLKRVDSYRTWMLWFLQAR